MKAERTLTRNQQRNLFFGLMVAVPILLFILFYGVINFNTILLAFQKYEPKQGASVGYDVTFAGFENFEIVIKMLSYGDNWKMVTNSLTLWAFKLFIGLSVSIIFSYYVYKKMAGSRFFRVVLFLPNIISNLIMVYLFRYFVNNALISVMNIELGLLDNPATDFGTILFFNLWLGFAGQTLMFTSAMSSINESIVESAQIDGVGPIGELFYITIPMIYHTLTTFIIIGIAEIFVDQMSLMTFYDKFSILPRLRTVGYFLFQQAYESELVPMTPWLSNPDYGKLSYSQLSAFGVMISAVIIPISFTVKKLLDKISPSES
jgi:ABC-type sugar transport system permease subunit